jgi:hypothetical protein
MNVVQGAHLCGAAKIIALLGLLALLLLCLASAAAVFWLFERSPAAAFLGSCRGVAPTFIGAMAVLFALICAFLASEVWQRRAAALAIVLAEASAARTLLRAANALGAPAAPLADATRAYVQTVIAEEWPAMRSGRSTEGATGSTRRLFDLGLADPRLLAQVAISTVHTGQPRPMALALVIISVVMAVAMGVVAVNDRPFTGQGAAAHGAGRDAAGPDATLIAFGKLARCRTAAGGPVLPRVIPVRRRSGV